MNIRNIITGALALGTTAALTLALCACQEEIITPPDPTPEEHEQQPAPTVGDPEEYHQKIRTVPYPRENNELFINPAPLIVPQTMSNTTYRRFELSQSADFSTGVEASGLVAWNMYNPHHRLAAGTWYWRWKSVKSDGTEGEWSDPIAFTVSGTEQEFVTPTWEAFLAMAPQQGTPRIYCFLDAKLETARANAPSHPEYASLIQRAGTAVTRDYRTELQNLYANHDLLYQQVEYLYQAYQLTHDGQYAAKLTELLDAMLSTPCSSSVLYSDNFITSTITYAHAAVLDLLRERLSAAQIKDATDFVEAQCKRFYSSSKGYEENHIFDNHFWQINYRLMFAGALTLYDQPNCPYALRLLEYLYELWTARAPASGFNRTGSWHNGSGYFTTNSKTLAYMPLLLSYITRFDFTRHPWYGAAGQALAYIMPPSGANVGFGDGQEKNTEPNRQMAAFADFLARETGDAFATWYATSRPDLVRDDWELRIYRMCNTDTYLGDMATDFPMLTLFEDAGEVAIHTELTESSTDLALGFRSSPYGSGSHTTSSQNAFNLVYGGKTIFRSSGYYQSFSDAHNLMWYRHTRGQNSVLINGIGQPYTTAAYGRILRAGSGASIAYALGDASHAYCGFTDDEMWVKNFAAAGIEQTPENGFGPTPLTKYLRHIAVLQPGIVVLYDELEASEAARWEWLLHSPVEFDIDAATGMLVTTDKSAERHCRVLLAASSAPVLTQTSKFLVPPATQGASYPDQWHFTATIADKSAVRILAIMEPCNIADEFTAISGSSGTYAIGQWNITAELDPARPATLNISNRRTGATLDLGTAPTVTTPDGTVYYRDYTSSTVLIDGAKATLTKQEFTDSEPQSSRTIH